MTSSSPAQRSVQAGVQKANSYQFSLIFRAATNGHHAASYDMYRAYKEGLGVAKDTLQAYAWLQLHVDTDRTILSPSVRRPELNRLALEVDVATSQEGKRLAALYRSGNWPELVVQAAPEPKPATSPATLKPQAAPSPTTPDKPVAKSPPKPAPALRVNSIALGQNPTAIINGKMVGVGETVTIQTKPQACVLKCLKIDKDSVTVSIEGEPEPRQLWFR